MAKLSFRLVMPERELVNTEADMVVVPGAEGDFGAMPQHSLLISAVRPGVIDVYQKGAVTQRIFVAGGFAEVTGERCTVLAEEAYPVAELEAGKVGARTEAARKKLAEAADDHSRALAQREIAVCEAMLLALSPKGEAH